MPHHICFVGLTAAPVLAGRWGEAVAGGAEVQQAMLARGLARCGHQVSFIIQHPDLPEEQEIDGIRAYCIRPARTAPGLNAAIKWRRAWRVLMRIAPTVIYQRMAEWTTGLSAAAARRLNALFVHAVASDREVGPAAQMDANLWQRRMHRWGIRRADVVLAQHAEQVELLRQHVGLTGPTPAVRIFPSGYPPASGEHHGPRAGAYWVGTVRETKRPRVLLEAARAVPQMPFVMVGGHDRTPEAEAYHAQIASEANALSNVEFLGFRQPNEVDERLSGAAVLVNTSEFEGFPMTFIQAWRQGVPTIGFRSSGRAGVLEQCGWAVDSADELVALLWRLQAHPEEARIRGRQARAYFTRQHSLDVVVPRLEALIEEQLAVRGAAVHASNAS